VVVFCLRTADLSQARSVCESTGRSVSELSGKRRELESWQQGDTTALIVQIQAGGIGIDLTRASSAYFWSLGFSLADYLQAIARLHRPGQSRVVSIWHLLATIDGRPTVDGRVYDVIRQKGNVVDEIIRGYRAGAPAGAR
jgi:SNF2 family DNA or RNA helicase